MKRSIIYILSILVAVAASAADYRLWIDNFEIKPGETKTVNLNMDNATEVTGLQTDLVLPEGLEILQDEDGYFIELNPARATRNHSWGCNATPDGVIHIISYTQDVRPFNLSSGPVMSITFKASKSFSGENVLEIKNSELVNANGQSFFPADETCKVQGGDGGLMPGEEFMVGSIKYVVNDDVKSVIVTYTELDSHDNYKGLTAANIPATVVYSNHSYKVSGIGEKAFKNCDDLASVVLPEGLDSIGFAAFHTCPKLTEFKIPASVSKIGLEVLRACNSLSKITVASGNTVYNSANSCNAIVETASKTLVAGCKTTVIPSDTKIIGDFAFAEHTGLASAKLPATVEIIGKQAFVGCSGLKNITLPNGLKAIRYMAFRYCHSLESITIPASVNEIGQGILRDCTGLKTAKILSENPAIEDWTFWGCSSLTDVNIPASVKQIKYGAFYQCTSLKEVEIPAGVESLGDYAFSGCSALTKATIPASITSYGERTFRDCSALADIYAAYKTPVVIPLTSFSSISYNNAVLHVPAGCTGAYKVTEAWKNFAHIVDDNIPSISGDVNNDGVVDITDANILVDIVLGKDSADKYGGRADKNNDGSVDIDDLNSILDKVLGR